MRMQPQTVNRFGSAADRPRECDDVYVPCAGPPKLGRGGEHGRAGRVDVVDKDDAPGRRAGGPEGVPHVRAALHPRQPALAARADSDRLEAWDAVADGTAYDGPRGTVEFRGRHARQPVHLAIADGVDFDVLTTLPALAP